MVLIGYPWGKEAWLYFGTSIAKQFRDSCVPCERLTAGRVRVKLYNLSSFGLQQIEIPFSTVSQARESMYKVGNKYTRNDIYRILAIPSDKRGGDWLNGYHRHGNDYYVFCNVGVSGRTGHDYDNHWEGDRLVWHGKTHSHFGQDAIKNLVSGEYRVLIFHRSGDRDPFTFAGVGRAIPDYSTQRPVRIDWAIDAGDLEGIIIYPGEYASGSKFMEGSRTRVYVNRYERDPHAREECIAYHGTDCAVCGFSFVKKYGEVGAGFIHVHHLVPVSAIGESYVVDAVTDMVPVCPNCHAMIHKRNPPYTVEEMRTIVQQLPGAG